MRKESFEWVWEDAITPVIDAERKKCIAIDTVDKYDFHTIEKNKLKHNIIRSYNTVKQHLKDHFYKAKNDDEEDNLIDVHKIAACLCYSLIQNKPFSFIVSESMPREIFLSNYNVAYHVSLAFIFMTLISEYEINGHEEYAKSLMKKGCMMEPPVSKGHNSYNEGRVFALAQNDLYGNTFDILGYADMMYWVEFYTRQCIERTVSPIELDRKGAVKTYD